MDGSGITVFLEQAGRVHALALHNEARALYWAALDPPLVEYAYLNGTGRTVLADDIPMPYALTLYGDRVFWGDWNTGKFLVTQEFVLGHTKAVSFEIIQKYFSETKNINTYLMLPCMQ